MAFEIEVRKNPFASAKLYIDENVLRFDDKEVAIKDITGFGYMSTQTSVNGINSSKRFDFTIWTGEGEAPFKFGFAGAFGGGAANDKYLTITDQVWNYFGDNLLNQMHKDLLAGKTIEHEFGMKLLSKGIVFRRKPLFKPAYEVLAPWNDLKLDTYNGILSIKSNSNKKARGTMGFNTKNTWVLYHYIHWLSQNPEVVRALLAIPNNYQLIEKS